MLKGNLNRAIKDMERCLDIADEALRYTAECIRTGITEEVDVLTMLKFIHSAMYTVDSNIENIKCLINSAPEINND